MTLRRVARRTRIKFLLLGSLPEPSIGIEDLRAELGEQFLKDSSSVDSSFVLTERVLEGNLDDVLETWSDGVEVGVTDSEGKNEEKSGLEEGKRKMGGRERGQRTCPQRLSLVEWWCGSEVRFERIDRSLDGDDRYWTRQRGASALWSWRERASFETHAMKARKISTRSSKGTCKRESTRSALWSERR